MFRTKPGGSLRTLMCLSNRSALQGATWGDVSDEARRVPADPHVPVESERLARRDVGGCFGRSPEGPCGPSCACRIGAPCKARRGGMFRTKPGGSLRTLMCLSNRSALQGATWRDVSNEARRVPADPHVPVESERLARRDVEVSRSV